MADPIANANAARKCTSCGGTLADEARFCPACGTAAPSDTAPAQTESTRLQGRMGTGAQLTIWLLVLLWLALIGMVASLAIPLFEGAKVEVSESLPIFVVLYLIGRLQQAQRKWLYPLVGFVGFLLMYAAGGYISNKASDELMGALSSLDPSLAIEMRSAGSN
jgi:hypothetical protein